MIGVEEENIYEDVEGIEHHLSWDSITCIEAVLELLQRNPAYIEQLNEIRRDLEKEK